MALRNRIRSALGWAVAAVVLVWVGYPLVREFGTARAALVRPDALLLTGGVGAFLVYFALRAVLWRTVAYTRTVPIGWRVTLRVWFLTEFARYLPGSVWLYLGRVGALRAEGVPVRETTVHMVREAVTIVATAALVALVFIAGTDAAASGLPTVGLAVAAGAGCIALLLPLPSRASALPIGRRVRSLLLGIVTWAAFALGSALVLRAFHAPGSGLTLALLSVEAWLAGYLALLPPSGLGVREAVLAAALVTGGSPAPVASALALAVRVVLTAVEAVLVLAVLRVLPRTSLETGNAAGVAPDARSV